MTGGDRKPSDFWSRRKAAVRQAEEAEQAEAVARVEAHEAAELEQKTDEEILEELGLPDPDALTAEDDFSAFMASKVPERLRKRALRQLWRSNPVLANLDGLNDYDEDFTTVAGMGGVVSTAYKVGRGFLDMVIEDKNTGNAGSQEPQELADTVADAAEQQGEECRAAPSESCTKGEDPFQKGQLTEGDRITQTEVASADAGPSDADEPVPGSVISKPGRRMRFSYD